VNKAKVLVTGAGGHLGQALLEGLSAKYGVTAVSRTARASTETIHWKTYDALTAADFDCELVVHAAAAHPRAMPKPELSDYMSVNLELLQKILDLSVAGKTRRFVFISSHYLNQDSALGWNRLEIPVYAASKLMGETLVKEYRDRLPLLVSLRLPGLLSPRAPASSLLVDLMIKMREGRTFELTGTEKPFEFIDVRSVTQWCEHLVETAGLTGFHLSTLFSAPVWTLGEAVDGFRSLLEGRPAAHPTGLIPARPDEFSKKMGFAAPDTQKMMDRFTSDFLRYGSREKK
jgi:nucleoside-diphosphate-sugar epimerase